MEMVSSCDLKAVTLSIRRWYVLLRLALARRVITQAGRICVTIRRSPVKRAIESAAEKIGMFYINQYNIQLQLPGSGLCKLSRLLS